MKKFGKVLFAGLVLAAMALASSCSMNVRSGLAGKKFQGNEGPVTMTFEFGKKDQLKITVGNDDNNYGTMTGTYNCTSKENVTLALTTLEKYVENGVDFTAEIPESMRALAFAEFNGEYIFSLDGNTLTIAPAEYPDNKIELTRI